MTEQTTETKPDTGSDGLGYAVAGVLAVIALGAATRFLETQVPQWAASTPFAKVAKSIEFPIYAIALGLTGNVVLSKLALRDALSKGFRTELFIEAGWRPIAVFASATVVNIVVALGLATVLFGNFHVG